MLSRLIPAVQGGDRVSDYPYNDVLGAAAHSRYPTWRGDLASYVRAKTFAATGLLLDEDVCVAAVGVDAPVPPSRVQSCGGGAGPDDETAFVTVVLPAATRVKQLPCNESALRKLGATRLLRSAERRRLHHRCHLLHVTVPTTSKEAEACSGGAGAGEHPSTCHHAIRVVSDASPHGGEGAHWQSSAHSEAARGSC